MNSLERYVLFSTQFEPHPLVMTLLLRPALVKPPPLSNWPIQIIGISAVEINVDELDWCAAVERL